MAQTISDMLISILSNNGVKRIYGLTGDSLIPIGNSVRENGEIEWISVRHEESAAFAAGTEAFLTGELTVCAGTSGPGSVHLVNGLYEANRNNVPVLAIASHIPSTQVGLDYFQATDPLILFKDCSVFREMVSQPDQMPRLLQEGMQAALSQKGVAVIVLSRDIAEKEIDESAYTRLVKKTPSRLMPSTEDVEHMVDIINTHERVTLFCGIGCAEAKEQVLALASVIKSPIVHTIRAKDIFENENPFDAGMTGRLSMWESKKALENCDLLMLLGTDFPYNIAFPTKPTIVQIDINGKHLGRRSRLDFGIEADLKATLDMLVPQVMEKTDETHLRDSLDYKLGIIMKKEEILKKAETSKKLQPEYLTHMLSELAPENAVFIADVGLNDVWSARYLKMYGNRRVIGSFKHATMAAAVPSTIGAHYALEPETPIIALAGDGGLTMLMGELLSIVRHNIPAKIVVYNNGGLGYIDFESRLDDITPFQTELKNPNFAKLAEVIGIKGIRIDSSVNLEQKLREALQETGPVLIDAVTDINAMP